MSGVPRETEHLLNVLLGAFLLGACAPAAGGVVPERTLKGAGLPGLRGNALLYSVSGISVDDRGNTYVTDILEYALEKFDRRGRLVARTGRRGTGPGEFRAPSLSVTGRGRVIVVQMEDPRIEVFDTALTFMREITVSGGLPVDLAPSGADAFAVALCGDSTRAEVLVYRSRSDAPPARLRLSQTGCRFPLYAAVRIALSPGGDIVAAYLFMNRVEVYGRGGNYLRRFAIACMRGDAVSPGERPVPEETYFRKVLVDRDGSIVLLGGNRSPHPGRDLFICSPTGKLQRILVLAEKPRVVSLGGPHRLLATDESGTKIVEYMLK